MTDSQFICLIVFLVEYSVLLVLSSMIAVMLNSAAINAALFGSILWFISFGVVGVIYGQPIKSTVSYIAMHLFFNNFLPLGFRDVFQAEWSHISINEIIVHAFVNILLLLIVLIILTNIFPGNYIQRPGIWLSLCCLRRPFKPNDSKVKITLDRPISSWHHFEYGPISSIETIYVKNVVTFNNKSGEQRQSLKNVTMRFFKSEITILLGAHESGKTSLLNVLAGWIKPAIGDVYFDGTKSIYADWKEYQQKIDTCMWENPLCTSLSVKRNLIYLATIKQITNNAEEITIEVRKYLSILISCGIDGNEMVKNLNYSKRRLVALAGVLICNRSIILLKDPTKHMGFTDQRHYWNILRKEKIGRTVIISTTCIDEAEEIGDRIAIFNDGTLLASGSQFFLRSNFGVGFDLVI